MEKVLFPTRLGTGKEIAQLKLGEVGKKYQFCYMIGRIKDMFSMDRWIENFEGYINARIELLKYDMKESAAKWMAHFVVMAGLAVTALLGLFFLNFAIGFLLNHLIGNAFAGFSILSGFYLTLAFILYANRNNKKVLDRLEQNFRRSFELPPLNSEADHDDSIKNRDRTETN